MGSLDKGWVILSRGIRDHWIWDGKPVSRFQAWIDLILSANHEDKNIMFDGCKVTVKRGSLITSVRKLSARWGWGAGKTLKYLKELEKDGMIARDANSRRTLITIVNYSKYQNPKNTLQHTDGTQTERRRNADRAQTKNYKEAKKKQKEKDPLPPEQLVGVPDDEIEWLED